MPAYRPLPPRGSIRIDDRQRPLPTRWAELTLPQLRHLARLSLRGCRGWALAISCTLRAVGLRPAPWRPGQLPALAPRWMPRPRRYLEPLAAYDLGMASAFLFHGHDPAQPLYPQLHANPLPTPRGLQTWDPRMGDVRLDEFLLMLDTLQALRGAQGAAQARARLNLLLFCLYRPTDSHGRRIPIDAHTPRMAARIAARFSPHDRLIALWWAQSIAARIAAAYPDLFAVTAEPQEDDTQPPPSRLVYQLAQGDISRLPAIRQAYAVDTLQLLQTLAQQHAARKP